ncbi:carotenoid ester lipase precursor [Vararia minispora EC-137]|uniref:Carotenoid ester lipase n=1 Tax=Vararia minispora EC-137 TaxID=1314806 RepID=A0ACB8QEL1_9AGAM|nr:carotenoid ester lipase precursor [Vararia minispora EC-137]
MLFAFIYLATQLSGPPTVKLDDAVFTGKTVGRVSHFLGIPFAQAPTGDLRFRLPAELPPYEGNRMAQSFGYSCPQQRIALPERTPADAVNKLADLLGNPQSEDCLTLNVVKPANAGSDSNLPVAVWIPGGAFEIGGSALALYDGGGFIERSLALDQPVVVVSINYRLNGFGFLASKEVKDAGVGNLGLQDQRAALRWIQKYIASFGGDPSKVTIWGGSAGAMSVALHMLANDGDHEDLFRGAVMQSGSPIPVGPIENGQKYYDDLVANLGCGQSSDTLQCLRQVPYQQLKDAIDVSPSFTSYQGLNLAWLPRVDGALLKVPPQHQVLQGKVANVPFITGDCEDEGTLFSMQTSNLTTTAHLHNWLKSHFFPAASADELDTLLTYYPNNPVAGSPFGTGFRNMLGPQYKRAAALQGDGVFHAPRRFFLQQRAGTTPAWSFLSTRSKGTPFLGAVHGSDLPQAFGPFELRDYIIRFANHLDPNGGRGDVPLWPQYDLAAPKNLVFQDSAFWPVVVRPDDYRKGELESVTNMTLLYPL